MAAMTAPRLPGEQVDRLLREVVGGEPPAEVEARLRTELRQAWQRAAAASAADDRMDTPLRGAWRFLPARLVAAAAALMVVVGAIAQVVQAPRVLAASLSRRQAAVWVALQLAGVSAMESVIDAGAGDDQRVRYHIEWRRRGHTRVRIVPDPLSKAALLREVWIPERGGLVSAGAGAQRSADPRDPLLRDVEQYLSPHRIGDLIAGVWERIPDAPRDEPGLATFSVARTDGSSALHVALDTRNDLPVRIEEFAPAGTKPGATSSRVARLRWTRDETVWRRVHVPAPGAP